MDIRGLLIVSSLLGSVWLVLVGLGSALLPLSLAFGLAYLLFPIIKKIEEFGVKRHYTVPFVFLLMSLMGIISLVLIVPSLITDAKSLLQELPQNVASLLDKIEVLASEYGYDLQLSKESARAFIVEHTSEISSTFINSATNAFKGIFTNALKWLLAILNLFLVPLFFFYLINDFEKLTKGLTSFIPLVFRPKLNHYLRISNNVLSGYIRGQILVAAILSLLYGIGLTIAGLRFGFLIGFLSGWLSIIPYAGFTLGFTTSLIVGFSNFHGIGNIIAIVAVFISIQALEGTLITPRLVGNRVGLSALATMLALIVGGNFFGLLGMLVAIPVTAVLKTVLIDVKKEYQTLDLYK